MLMQAVNVSFEMDYVGSLTVGEFGWPIAPVFALLIPPRKAADLRYSADLRETTYCLFLKLQSRSDGGRSSAPILPQR